MKQRMHNNYDGYMYSVHHLSLGSIQYKGKTYILDDEVDAGRLLYQLEQDSILSTTTSFNEYYYETLYKIKDEFLVELFTQESIQTTFQQLKPTLLNIKVIIELQGLNYTI